MAPASLLHTRRTVTSSGARSAKTDALSLTRVVGEAYGRSAWPELRALYHDEALLCTIAAQQAILPPDDLIEIFARITAGKVYDVEQTSMTAIDDVACLVTGRIRYPLPGGGFGEGSRTWILTYKDGLLFRSCAYTNAAKARAAYTAHGVTLGIDAATGTPVSVPHRSTT